ncbi:TetR/AcrR family transcriptional regulator [Acidisphaera sp. L21]|uniref:TetR/AcrR family transcriptional regulator n=1 Tax=Acidisphaera sp. L21 TaxID=1641851 RepID=UPI0020B14AE5|nr:TetR/AcrR family transcriptional regulator [Acidisphaera sp. L21]
MHTADACGKVQAEQWGGDGMARPREFDEGTVLDAAVLCFWTNGYDATSVKDLVAGTGITAASLYNAFGDKRSIYQKALDHYVEGSIADRIRRCEELPPLAGIEAFFEEIVRRSLSDRARKGCMLVNAALDVAPHDPDFRKVVAEVLLRIEAFFLRRIEIGQSDGTISMALPASSLAHNLLGVLMGIRVLARVRPERGLLEGVLAPTLTLLRCGALSPQT